jgi:hypothetical protein
MLVSLLCLLDYFIDLWHLQGLVAIESSNSFLNLFETFASDTVSTPMNSRIGGMTESRRDEEGRLAAANQLIGGMGGVKKLSVNRRSI